MNEEERKELMIPLDESSAIDAVDRVIYPIHAGVEEGCSRPFF